MSRGGVTMQHRLFGRVARCGDLVDERRLGEAGVALNAVERAAETTFGSAHQRSANASVSSVSRSDGSVHHTSIVS